MRQASFWAAVLAGVLVPAACGGRATLESFEGESKTGSTGAGASGSTSSSSDASSSVSSVSSVSSSASSVVSSSSGGSMCENTSNSCDECTQCTLQGACEASLDACFNSPECDAFVSCIEGCFDEMCTDQCVMMFPNGWLLYEALVKCAFCENCPNLCSDQLPPDFCDP